MKVFVTLFMEHCMAECCVTVVLYILYSPDTVYYDSFFPKLKLYPAGRTKNHRTAGLTTLSGCKETTSKVVAWHSYFMC